VHIETRVENSMSLGQLNVPRLFSQFGADTKRKVSKLERQLLPAPDQL